MWEISENFNKRGGGLKSMGGWEFFQKFNLTKQGSHDTTGRACCGVRYLAGNARRLLIVFDLTCDSLSDLKN